MASMEALSGGNFIRPDGLFYHARRHIPLTLGGFEWQKRVEAIIMLAFLINLSFEYFRIYANNIIDTKA